MFEGTRMILKRGMKISHGGVTCIASLGKQAEVCEPQFLHQPGTVQTLRISLCPAEVGMQRQENDQGEVTGGDQQKYR